jgi:hypothetical protein
MAIKLVVRGIDELKAYLKTVPYGTVKVSLAALADWYVGQDDRGLRHYEPYKYITPMRSFSDNKEKRLRQLRWIFAHKDLIGKNNRTNDIKNSWRWKTTNNGYGVTFENESRGAGWLWSDKNQTRQNAAVGHRTIMSKVQSNLAGAMRHAQVAVNKWLKKNR